MAYGSQLEWGRIVKDGKASYRSASAAVPPTSQDVSDISFSTFANRFAAPCLAENHTVVC